MTRFFKVPVMLADGVILLDSFNPGALPVLGLQDLTALTNQATREDRQIFAKVCLERECLVIQQLFVRNDCTIMHEAKLGGEQNPLSKVISAHQPLTPSVIAKIAPAFLLLKINCSKWRLTDTADQFELTIEEARDILNN